jgi:hypothetical protein
LLLLAWQWFFIHISNPHLISYLITFIVYFYVGGCCSVSHVDSQRYVLFVESDEVLSWKWISSVCASCCSVFIALEANLIWYFFQIQSQLQLFRIYLLPIAAVENARIFTDRQSWPQTELELLILSMEIVPQKLFDPRDWWVSNLVHILV